MVGEKPPADSKTAGRRSSSSVVESSDDAHDLAQLRGFGAIDGEHEGLLKEGVLNGLQVGVERDDAVAARLVGEGDQFSNQMGVVLARRGEDVSQAAEGGHNRGKRELEQHRAQRAAKDNKRRSGLQQSGRGYRLR